MKHIAGFLSRDFLRSIRIKKIEVMGLFHFILHMCMPMPSSSGASSDINITGNKEGAEKSVKRSIADIPRAQCIGCGLCFSACAFDAISMTRDDTGFIPVLDEGKCIRCGLCFKVCPGINILSYPEKLGDIKKIIVSHAVDPTVRHNASSGGTARSILAALLEQKIVDRVIITRATDDPYLPETIITASIDDLTTDSLNSVYSPVSPLAALKGLDKNLRYAFVGLPCHIAGLALCPGIKKNIYATIGIFCSHTPSFKFVDTFLHDLSPVGGVQKVRYRGDGWPGNTKVKFKDGNIFGIRFPFMWHRYNYSRQFQQPRCSSCTYYSAEYADISIGDPWSLAGKDHEGSSLVFIRTQRGMEIVDAAVQRITAEEVSSEQEDSILSFHRKSAASKLKNAKA